MIGRRSDLPLSHDPSVRLVPWIIGLMTYLACLMLAGSLLLSELLGQWSSGLSGTVTVQVLPLEREPARLLDERVDKLVRILERTDGITGARAIPLEEIATLLEPWLGGATALDALPLPRLIDVRLDMTNPPPMEELKTMLSNADSGALLDDHGIWQDQLADLVGALEMVAGFVVLLVGLATVGIVIFATRSGMAAHQDVIEVLHLIGAEDGYIARQFQNLALTQGLRGGIIGIAFGAATIWGLGYAADHIDSAILPPVRLLAWHWAVLASLPAATALIAKSTARRTVMRSLKRMV
jgi:cell division transport system permease protein